jgi:hypothetical protein
MNDWHVRGNAVFNFQDGCNEAINGICLKDISIEDCINTCKLTNGECTAGYYIHQTSSNPSICVPIKTDVNPMINPVNILKSKGNYKDLNGIETSAFWNTTIFPLTSTQMTNVLFRTVLGLKNKETGLYIQSSFGKEEVIQLSDNESESDIVITHPSFYMISTDLYKPVMYNDSVMINALNTSLKITPINGEFHWKILSQIGARENAYIFISTSGKTDNIKYGDEFYIKSSTGHIMIVKDKILKVSSDSVDKLKELNIPHIFSFSSRETGYYCDSEVCHQVSGKNIFSTDNIVTRDKSCGNLCNQDSKRYASGHNVFTLNENENSRKISKSNIFKIVVVSTLLVFVGIVIFLLLLRH